MKLLSALASAPALALVLAAAVAPLAAGAQDFPAQPIRVVSPAPAGGTLDSAMRIIAERATGILGQRIVIDSKTGASGNIAGETIARAAPDGYSLLLGYDAIHATNPHIFKAMPFDGVKDFVPIVQIGSFPVALVVRTDFPAKNFEEFIAYAKANPGKVNYGTPGMGSTHHLAAEVMNAQAKVRLTHIPYKGADGIAIDMAGGRLDAGFFSLASAMKVATSNQGRILAVAEPKRLASLPDIPAFNESYPGAVVQAWFGLLAPRGTPAARIEKLEAAFVEALRDPAVLARLTAAGVSVTALRGADFAQTIQGDFVRRGELIKTLNIRSE